MQKKNLETWRRVARVKLIELIRELGDAAMATLKEWPAAGEGRSLKEACEKANKVLIVSNLSQLAAGMKEIEGVVEALRSAAQSEYFHQHVAPRKIRTGRWRGQLLGDVVGSELTDALGVISENRTTQEVARKVVRPEIRAFAQKSEPLASLAPPQQTGPVQFEFRNGVLRVRPQRSGAGDKNPIGAEHARKRLVKDAAWLVENFAKSNIDQRAIVVMEEMEENLASSQNVIEIGIANFACGELCSKLEDEISAPISAKWKAFSVGVSLYVSQFSDWHAFVDNATDFDATEDDARKVHQVGAKLAQDLRKIPGIADPEVPRSIEILLEAMSTPGKAGKRALFAVVRTIENVVAKIFSEFGEHLNAAFEGSREAVKQTVKWSLLYAAAIAACNIAPNAQHIVKTDWLKAMGETAIKSLAKVD